MWIVCITSVRHVLTVNGYGGRQTKENEKSQCFKGWETLVREFIHETFISKAVKTLYAHLCRSVYHQHLNYLAYSSVPSFLCAPYHVSALVYHSISQKSQKSNFSQYKLSCHFYHPTQTHKRLVSNTFTLNVKNDRKMKSKKLLYNT